MSSRFRIEMGQRTRGWVLRLPGVASALVGVWVLVDAPFWQVLGIITAVVGAIIPRSMVGWFPIVAIVFGLLGRDMDLGNTAVALLCAHLIHLSATWGAVVSGGALVQLRALRAAGVRFLVIQGLCQATAFAVGALLTSPDAASAGWIAPIGAAAVVGFVAVVLVLQRRSPQQ